MIPPSFHSASSSAQNDGMMSISASHPKIKELLHPYIANESRQECFACCNEDQCEMIDENIVDFGCRYRVIVQKAEPSNKNSTDILIFVHVGIIGWDEVEKHAIPNLQLIFGANAVICKTGRSSTDKGKDVLDAVKIQDTVYPGFDVAIKVNSKELEQGQTLASCFDSLCKLRSAILGCRLMSAFRCMSDKTKIPCIEENDTFQIPIQRNYKTSFQSMVVMTTQMERVTIVIPVAFHDDTDRALAKLFLQQFQQAQRRSSAKNVPICEFRRPNEPPREIASFLDTREKSFDTHILAGYISFTFLDNHFKTEKDRERVTDHMLMLPDYMDYHIKCSKSFMHTRMREKKNIMLRNLTA